MIAFQVYFCSEAEVMELSFSSRASSYSWHLIQKSLEAGIEKEQLFRVKSHPCSMTFIDCVV